MSSINVTKKPIFSIEKPKSKSGKFKARYTIEIDGEEFSTTVESTSESSVFELEE